MLKYIIWKKAVVIIGSFLFFIPLAFSENIRVDVGGSIKVVPLNEYVCGVVGEEMGENYPLEALKAQAVCARTNALYYRNIARRNGLPYDIKDSVFDQVYDKSDGQYMDIENAVNSTKGEILTYHNKVVEAFFCASSGGYTESADNVWGPGDPYTISKKDPYSKGGKYGAWTKVFSPSQLGDILGLSSVKDIKILKKDSSGRIQCIEVITYSGKKEIMCGDNFSLAFIDWNPNQIFTNPDTLPSARFKIKKSGDDFIFQGSGYGHGVGMSQYGSKVMAEDGFDYKQILKYYFPLLKLTKINPNND